MTNQEGEFHRVTHRSHSAPSCWSSSPWIRPGNPSQSRTRSTRQNNNSLSLFLFFFPHYKRIQPWIKAQALACATHGFVVLAETDDFGVLGEAAAHGEPSDGLHGQSEQVSADGRVLRLWV